MTPQHHLPADIERTSISIITRELDELGLTPPPETAAARCCGAPGCFPGAGAAGAAGALPVCMAARAASISAREAPFSAMARATSSISLVKCGINKDSERSSPRRLFGFC